MIEQEQISEEQVREIEHYNPVNVTLTESTGILAMSIIALILLIALLRAQRRNRDLQEQIRQKAED